MKLTESQLRKLVKEEIDAMVEEGGLMDFVKGVTDPTTAAAKAAGSNIKKFAKKSWRSGQLAQLAGDLERNNKTSLALLQRIKKLAPSANALAAEIEDGLQTSQELVGMLKKKEITERNKRKRK